VQCDESLSVGLAARMIKKQNVSAIFGPTCRDAGVVVAGLFKNSLDKILVE
jgi:ABC-type branched-subunit amino acid transport system substrate-binding protein